MRRALLLLIAIIAFQNASGQETASVVCGTSDIKIKLTQQFFLSKNIDITDPTQIHFKNHRECVAEPEEDGYSLTIKAPFTDCGMTSEPKAESHLFSHEVIYSTENFKLLLFRMSCEYQRKYTVSSEISLTPVVRTLSFANERGTFDVSMDLYQREDFNPKSMYGAKPVILIGVPVYAAVTTTDAFQTDNIVSTIEACYATDDKDHTTQNLIHPLITNKCVSDQDETVRILENGVSMEPKFKFNMFRWNSPVEYFYLHCEIKICNTTSDTCVGVGPVCNGADPEEDDVISRKRRDNEEEVDVEVEVMEDKKGFISVGPIVITEEDEIDFELGGESYMEDIQPTTVEIEKDQGFLQVYIYVIIAIVIILVGFLAVTLVVVRRRRQKRQMLKEGSVTSSEVNSVEGIKA